MILNELYPGLTRIANGDYVLEGDLSCEETLEVELDDRLVVRGSISVKNNLIVKRGIEAGCGIKAGWGIEAGEGIKAGWGIEAGEGIKAGWGIEAGDGITARTSINAGKRIFAGVSVYRTSDNCIKTIKCAELVSGEICYGDLEIIGEDEVTGSEE